MIDFSTKEKIKLSYLKDNFDCPVMLNHNGDKIECDFMGLKFDFTGNAFRQVNDEIAEKIYSEVLEEVKGKNIINAFSGAGVMSGLLAKSAGKVYGIELNGFAHQSAENLKQINSIDNLENICGYHKTCTKELFLM